MDGKIIIIGATGYAGSALAKLFKQEKDRKSTRLNSSHT